VAYATQTDIENALDSNELLRLTDDTGSASTYASGIVTAALDYGAGVIDGFTYRSPDPTGNDAKSMNITLALKFLYQRKRESLPQELARDVDRVDAMLKDWARGGSYPDGGALLPKTSTSTEETRLNAWDSSQNDYTRFLE